MEPKIIGWKPKGEKEGELICKIWGNKICVEFPADGTRANYLKSLNVLEALCDPIYEPSPSKEERERVWCILDDKLALGSQDVGQVIDALIQWKNEGLDKLKAQIRSDQEYERVNALMPKSEPVTITTDDDILNRWYDPHLDQDGSFDECIIQIVRWAEERIKQNK